MHPKASPATRGERPKNGLEIPGRSVVRADHREAEAAGLYSLLFPLGRNPPSTGDLRRQELKESDFDLDLTGFAPGEIDSSIGQNLGGDDCQRRRKSRTDYTDCDHRRLASTSDGPANATDSTRRHTG